MRSRVFPILGPLVVLYLATDAARVRGGLPLFEQALVVLAVALTATPLLLRRHVVEATRGARRVAMLGLSLGLVLGATTFPPPAPFGVVLLRHVALALASALVLDLAFDVPEPLPKGRRHRLLVVLLGVGAVGTGLFDLLPAPVFRGEAWLVAGSIVGRVPGLLWVLALAGAVVARASRHLGPTRPGALAANAWALLGLVPAGAVFVFTGTLFLGGEPTWARVLAAGAVVSLLYGHVALVDPSRRIEVGLAARRLLAIGAAAVLVVVVGPRLLPLATTEWSIGAVVVLLVAGALAVSAAVEPLLRRVLAPAGGRLLDACVAAEKGLALATTLDEVGRVILVPMRDASGDPVATPRLLLVDPALEIRIDAARMAHVRPQAMSPALLEQMRRDPSHVIVLGDLLAQLVRRPATRALAETLDGYEALCAVPLCIDGEPEGALVVPRGRRRRRLTLEEIHALESLGRTLSAWVSMASARARADRRATEAEAEIDRAEERIELLQESVARLRAEATALRATSGTGSARANEIAYSPAMRALLVRFDDIAPTDAPVLLRADAGVSLETLGRAIHARSSRAEGPFVVADCAAVRPEEGLGALVGAEGEAYVPGWLRLASGGTLFLLDVPALDESAQRALAEALATRQARPLGVGGPYPVDVRIVATSRVEIEPLVRGAAFDPELGRWLGARALEVPPLGRRREDVASLALLAIDRACRVLGREVVGIEQGALDVLLAREWPGNQRELEQVIDRAVQRTSGAQILRDAIAPVRREEVATPQEGALDGTYAELERRVFAHAIARAHGNKSEAARLLGLKRTTFLDKLRRMEMEDAGTTTSSPPSSEDAA